VKISVIYPSSLPGFFTDLHNYMLFRNESIKSSHDAVLVTNSRVGQGILVGERCGFWITFSA